MATVTGTLKDFGMAALTPYQPVLTFQPSGPGLTPTALLATKAVRVTPAADGSFSVNLQPTDDVRPERWYEIRIEWLDAAANYVSYDFIDWRLQVGSAGGNLTDIVSVPATPSSVWVGETPPKNPVPGLWWLKPSTGDLYEWS